VQGAVNHVVSLNGALCGCLVIVSFTLLCFTVTCLIVGVFMVHLSFKSYFPIDVVSFVRMLTFGPAGLQAFLAYS